jgi:hypothetical protein
MPPSQQAVSHHASYISGTTCDQYPQVDMFHVEQSSVVPQTIDCKGQL